MDNDGYHPETGATTNPPLRPDGVQAGVNERQGSDAIREKMKRYLPIILRLLALVSVVLFFFPLCTVSCSGEEIGISGIKATFGFEEEMTGQEVEGNFGFILALVLPLAIFGVFFVKNKKFERYREYLIAGLAAIVLIMLYVFKKTVEEEVGSYATVAFTAAYKLDVFVNVVIILAVLAGVGMEYWIKHNAQITAVGAQVKPTAQRMAGGIARKLDQFAAPPEKDAPMPQAAGVSDGVLVFSWYRDGIYQQMVLHQFPIVIGRSAGEGVQAIDSIEIDEKHAQIDRVGGKYYLSDLGTSKGSSIDGVPVDKMAPLYPGCLLRLGNFDIHVNIK